MWKNIILGMSLLNILLLYIIWYYSYHIISYCIIYHAYYIIYYIITESYYLILYQSFYIVSFILYKLYRGEKADTIIKKQLQTRNAYIDIELNIAAAALPQINPCTPLTAPLGIYFGVSRVVTNKRISGLLFLPCFLLLSVGFTDRFYCIRYCVQVVI